MDTKTTLFSPFDIHRAIKSLRNNFENKGVIFFFILPVLLLLLVFLFYPLLYEIFISFTNISGTTGLQNYSFVGLKNYTGAFDRQELGRVLVQSGIWTIVNLICELAIGLTLALILNSLPRKITPWIQAVWLIPWVIPGLAWYYTWRILEHPQYGAFNYLLLDLHLISKPIAWISNPNFALWGVIIATLWKSFPFVMTMLYAALQSIPQDLYEAGKVDGANRIQLFFYLEFPYITPILFTSATLMVIWIFNNLSPVFAMTMGGPGNSSMIFSIYIWLTGMRYFRYGEAAALAILVMLVLSVFIYFYMRFTTRNGVEA